MRSCPLVNPRTVESVFGVCVAKLNELKSFGELALQGKGLRAASIITSEDVGLVMVGKHLSRWQTCSHCEHKPKRSRQG
jgi:hypothetical protein